MQERPSSPLTPNALNYTWRQLAQRAGVAVGDPPATGFERLGVSVHYARPDQVQVDPPAIIVTPSSEAAWEALLERAPCSLKWMPVRDAAPQDAPLPFDGPIPVLFWGEGYEDGGKPFAERRKDGIIVFYADIVATAFFMLSRWEETVVPTRDEHQRFPATASVACKQEFLDRPIVDEYALVLQAWLRSVLPRWEPEPRRFSVKLTHDIDLFFRFPSLYRFVRALGADVLKRHSPKLAWQTGIDAVKQLMVPQHHSYFAGIYLLAELSSTYGLDSAFYLMTADPGPLDDSYDLSHPLIRECIEDLRQRGFELGFHAGYHTLNDPARLATEKARLDAALGETQYGGRQHYLRFQVPNTWRHWEQVGLTYDSTMIYADREGFRCGTCHRFRPFDVEQDRELNLWELPLIVMDRSLRDYRQLKPEEGKALILKLARRCEQVGGTFTLLWHNSLLTGEWRPWAEMYRQVTRELGQLEHSKVDLNTGEER